MIPGIFGVHSHELGGRVTNASHFVIGNCQVQTSLSKAGRLLERRSVFRDGLFVASQPSQRCAQVGMDGGRLRVQFQELTVLFDSSLEIARLLLLHRILHEFLRGKLRRLCANDRAEYQQKQQRVSMHTAGAVFTSLQEKNGMAGAIPFKIKQSVCFRR